MACQYFVNGDWVTENQLKELLNAGLLDTLISDGTVAIKGFKTDATKVLKAETTEERRNEVIPAVKLANILANEVKTRQGYPLNMLSALELNEAGTDFKIPLWASPYKDKFESLLTSLVSNKIVKQKFPGNSYVLGSQEGFQIREGDEAAGDLKNSNIVFSANFDPSKGLQPMRWDFENKKILPAQIMIPFKFRDENGNILPLKDFMIKGEDGRMMLDTSKLPEKLLQLFGFRIPSQERNSMAAVEIVGFLPEASGDLMLAPRDFTKQMGSDFDVDKLYTYMYNHFYKDGKLQTGFMSNKKKIAASLKIQKQHLDWIKKELKLNKEDRKLIDAYIEEKIEYAENGTEISSELAVKASELIANAISKNSGIVVFSEGSAQRLTYDELIKTLDNTVETISILNRSYKAARQNNILDIHLRIMKSSNPEIINSIMALDSFGEFEGLAKEINNIRNAGKALPIILSDTYQRTKFINATAGKNGVGSFSLDSTFNATAQGKEITLQNLTAEAQEELFGTFLEPRVPTTAQLLEANMPLATFGEIESKGDLSNKYTLKSQALINLAKLAKRDLTTEEKESLKLKSSIIRALQSTAVDNEKAQILDKLNINDETFDVIRALTLLGFEEQEIVGLITQEIVWEYVDKLRDASSSLTSYNPNAAAEIFTELAKKYDPKGDYAALEASRIEQIASKSGKDLIDNIENKTLTVNPTGTTPDYNLEQLALLEKFQNLAQVGKDIKVLQSTINTESSGIPKSLLETQSKVEQVQRLPYLNIFNANKLLGEYEKGTLSEPTTINGYASYYGTMFADKIFNEYFPYKNVGFKTVVTEVKTHMPKGADMSVSKTVETQGEVFNEIRSYLYANTSTNLFGENPDVERRRLFIDSKKTATKNANQSLASILQELSKKPWYQKNGFLNKLSFDINKNGTISRINFEAAAGENFDERNIYDGFNYLLSKNFSIGNFNGIDYTSRILAQELVAAAFLEGGTQGSKQYLKFVPIAYLKSLGFGEYLQGVPFDFVSTFYGNVAESGPIYAQPSTFTRQYFQNNPDKVKTVSLGDLKGKQTETPKESFTLDDKARVDNFVEVIDPLSGEPTQEQTHFLSIYDNKLPSKYALYEFDSVDRLYRRISVLAGSYGFVGYNSQNRTAMPVEVRNLITTPMAQQIAPGYTISNIPVTPTKAFDINTVNNTVKRDTAATLPINRNLTGTKEALDDLLNNLEGAEGVSTLNTQLLQLIRGLQLPENFKVTYVNNRGRGSYNATSQILNVNLDHVNNQEINKLATTVAHELIHALTARSIKDYQSGNIEGLSARTIKAIQQLETLQKLYIDELIAKEGPEGLKAFEQFYKDWKEGADVVPNPANISKYYGAIKLEEFVTMALTDVGFQEHLNSITDETGVSLWEQLKELLADLLNALGLDINPGSALATAVKDSMDLIQANQETLKENNIDTKEFFEFGNSYKFQVDGNGKVVKAEYAQGNGIFKAMNAKNGQKKYAELKNKPSLQKGPTVAAINKIINLNPTEFTNYSGGAEGSDTAWEEIGKEFGIGKQVNYTPNDLKKLTSEQAKEIEDAYQQAVADLKRKPLSYNWGNPGKEDYSGGLVRRDYLQAKAADAVFAIGKILERGDKNSKGYVVKADQVDGGTGYAVKMAINLGKPVYVFDLTDNIWMKYNPEGPIDSDIPGEKGRFEQFDDVVLTPKFAGIGTREITEAGKQAIRDVYANTFKATTQSSNSVTPTIDITLDKQRLLLQEMDNNMQEQMLEVGKGIKMNQNVLYRLEQKGKELEKQLKNLKEQSINKETTTQSSTSVKPKGTINVYWRQAESATSTKILSNLAPRKFTYQGKKYGSVEHAYQSLKSGAFDQVTYDAYNNLKEIPGKQGPGYGTKIRGKAVTANFDNLQLMRDLVVESFKQNSNSEAAKKLLQYENFTHNTNEVIDKAFLEGLKLAQQVLLSTQPSISVKQSELKALGYGFYKGDDGTYDLNHPEDGIIAERVSLEEAISIAALNVKRESILKLATSQNTKYELFPGVFANAGQTTAIDKLKAFLNSDEKAFLLEGKGGTGKTTIIKQILSQVGNKKILAIAPSHKAKKVLAKSLKGIQATVSTLASALAINLDEATGEFTPNKYARDNGKVPIKYGQIIIIDESSMVSDAMLLEIKQLVSAGAKVIFMGDKAQLPPVGQEKDSGVFELKNNYTLTEKMRQAATSPIIGIGTKIAANAENNTSRVANPITSADRVDMFDAVSGSSITWEKSEDTALNQFVSDIQQANEDVNFAKIVTFNNQNNVSPQSVKNLNLKVRNKLFGERAKTEKFIPGELITAYDSYNPFQKNEPEDTAFYNSDDMTIVASKFIPQYTVRVEVFSKDKGRRVMPYSFDVDMLTVKDDEGKIISQYGNPLELPIIAESSKAEYAATLNQLWKTDRQLAYALQAKFGNIEYGYAVTSHKAQGSTYTNVYVMEDNIMGPSNAGSNKAKNQSLYVAVSRPTTKLVMVSAKNTGGVVEKSTGLNLAALGDLADEYRSMPTSNYGDDSGSKNDNNPSPDDWDAYNKAMGTDELLGDSTFNSEEFRNYLLICGK